MTQFCTAQIILNKFAGQESKYHEKYSCKWLFLIIIIISFWVINLNIFAQEDSSEVKVDSVITKVDSVITKVDPTAIDTLKTNKNAKIVVELPDPTLDPNSLDFRLFTSINYNRSAFKNAFFPIFDHSMAPMAAYMPISLFTYGRLYDKTYDENTGYLMAASVITNTAVTFGLKMLIKRKRVRVYYVAYGIYPKIFTSVDPYSFPSGHTSTSFAVATLLTLRYHNYPLVYIPALSWAVIIGYGRMYLGMHYPSDVLVGALIGTGSSVLIYSLRKEFFKFKNNVFNEQKSDEGSINAGVLTIFTAGFLGSMILDYFIPDKPVKKLTINASPFHNNGLGINLKINYKF